MGRMLLLAGMGGLAVAHMSLVVPVARNSLDNKLEPWSNGKWYPYEATCEHPVGPNASGSPGWNPQVPSGCKPTGTDGWGCNCGNGTDPNNVCNSGQSCFWFSNGCSIGCSECTGIPANPNYKDLCGSGMNATLNDPELRTYNRDAPAGSERDVYKHNPWRAPGYAPVLDVCGMASGGTNGNGGESNYYNTSLSKLGDNGSSLPEYPTGVVWTAGQAETVGWSIRANHGGGYSYRLCPADEDLTEACMQRFPLRFADNHHTLVLQNGSKLDIEGRYVDKGTWPKGSQWSMNPFPYSNNGSAPTFDPPCEESIDRTKSDSGICSGRDPFLSVITDRVLVPSDLRPGKYVLGIRWDCEKSAQVWQNCADIEVLAK